jgi:DNA-binding NtrC family response regulator
MTEIDYPKLPVMLVDDEEQALNSFEMSLRSVSISNVIRCHDSRDVMPVLARQEIEVILLDLWMPHVSGEELLQAISHDFPDIPVIIITGADDVQTAVTCMQHGAFDYIVKPVEKSRLVSSVRRAIELRELQRENQLLKAHVLSGKLERPEAFNDIITVSANIRSIFQYIEAIAASPRPVLITGETGVGKELIARAVHQLSQRKGNFVPINVAGLDDHVFADTLFGHHKGAFTGADQNRAGMLEQAAGGTLFLDEIGDLSPASQVKLLRLLQDGEFLPLGSDLAKRSDARIVVATNRDVASLGAGDDFRKDLYYRLCNHHIHIPPLRERREDLPALVTHFLQQAATSLSKKTPTPPDELITLLGTYQFPGNIRELESMIYDAVSQHRSGKMSMEVFKAYILKHRPDNTGRDTLAQAEAHPAVAFPDPLPTLKQASQLLVDEALQRAEGNQSIAAMMLGISRQALNKRIKKQRTEDG